LRGTSAHEEKRKTVKFVDRSNTIGYAYERENEGLRYFEVVGENKDGRQLVYDNLSVKRGKLYTFSVVLRSDVPSSILLRTVYSNRQGRTTKRYTQGIFETYDYTFIADRDDDNFRLSIGGFLEGVTYHVLSLSFREGGNVEYPKADDRPMVTEESFDVYTTSTVKSNPHKVLATINIQKVIDGVVVNVPNSVELRARAHRKYRVDMLATTTEQAGFAIVFRQGDQELAKTKNYDSFSTSGKPYIVSYTIESQQNENIVLSIENTKRSAVYKFEILQFKEILEQNNEKISLDTANIPLLFYSLISRYPSKLQDDWCEFLLEIDKAHWQDMYMYLKGTIGTQSLVTGTQIEYGSMHAQAAMDYCDIHGFWDHPVFPNHAWSETDWFCHNQPLVNILDKCPLLNMATKRVAGKPFTVSEYNHVWINRYSAEGNPIMALFGSRHGWDGVFPFCYDDGNMPASTAMYGYFPMRNNSVQLAHIIACNNLLTRDYNKDAEKEIIVAPLSESKELELFQKNQHTYSFGFNGLDLDIRRALLSPTAIDATGTVLAPNLDPITEPITEITARSKTNPADYFCYNRTIYGKHWLSASQGETQVFTGFVAPDQRYPFGEGLIEFDKTNLGWATVTMTEVKRDKEGVHYLFVATGEMRNTDQQYQRVSDNKITLNNSGIDTYGVAPVLCECLSVKLYDTTKPIVVYYPLDEAGNRTVKKTPINGSDFIRLDFSAGDKTIWYEIIKEN
jgi:hypothetical protein